MVAVAAAGAGAGVVAVVVAVSAVARIHDSRATTFGSRCVNKSYLIFRAVSDFRAYFFTVVPC